MVKVKTHPFKSLHPRKGNVAKVNILAVTKFENVLTLLAIAMTEKIICSNSKIFREV
jgi:hypothetical protein